MSDVTEQKEQAGWRLKKEISIGDLIAFGAATIAIVVAYQTLEKRIAIMDSDGSGHRYLTIGRSTVVTPRFSPRGDKLVYVSYIGRKPRVLLHDIASGSERLLIPGDHITFAPITACR